MDRPALDKEKVHDNALIGKTQNDLEHSHLCPGRDGRTILELCCRATPDRDTNCHRVDGPQVAQGGGAPSVISTASRCNDAWLSHGPDGLRITPDLMCFPYIVLVGSIPALLILAIIRRGAPIPPIAATMLASLAAAALGAAALRLFHMQDASLMVLVWHVGSVALLTGIGALMGRPFLRWPQNA